MRELSFAFITEFVKLALIILLILANQLTFIIMKNSQNSSLSILNLMAVSYENNQVYRFHLSHEDEPVFLEHIKPDNMPQIFKDKNKAVHFAGKKIAHSELEEHLPHLARYFSILDLGNKKWFDFRYAITQASYQDNAPHLLDSGMVWQISQAGTNPVLINPKKMTRAQLLMLLYDNKVTTAIIDDPDYPNDIVLGHPVYHAKHDDSHFVRSQSKTDNHESADSLEKVAPF